MNEKELKEYQDKLMEGAKGTIKLGIMTGIGSYAFGRVGENHPAVAPVANATNAALGLAAVGNMAAVGMSIAPGSKGLDTGAKNKKKVQDSFQRKYSKDKSDDVISKILG